MYNIRSGAIQRQMLTSYLIAIIMFAFSADTCQNSHLKFYLAHLGQGHMVEKFGLRRSIANLISTSIKSCTSAFFASSHLFTDIMYYMISRNCLTLKAK